MFNNLHHSIFISHSSLDKKIVSDFCTELEDRGYKTWASYKDITPGNVWSNSIEDALAHAQCILVFCSLKSIAPQNRWIRAEVEHGLQHGKLVIPILIEPIAHQLPLNWTMLQYISAVGVAPGVAIEEIVRRLPVLPRSALRRLLAQDAEYQPLLEFLVKHPGIVKNEFNEILKSVHTPHGVVDLLLKCLPQRSRQDESMPSSKIVLWRFLSLRYSRLTVDQVVHAHRAILHTMATESRIVNYGRAEINIVIGRRTNLSQSATRQRRLLENDIRGKIAQVADVHSVTVAIMTYDRLLEL